MLTSDTAQRTLDSAFALEPLCDHVDKSKHPSHLPLLFLYARARRDTVHSQHLLLVETIENWAP